MSMFDLTFDQGTQLVKPRMRVGVPIKRRACLPEAALILHLLVLLRKGIYHLMQLAELVGQGGLAVLLLHQLGLLG